MQQHGRYSGSMDNTAVYVQYQAEGAVSSSIDAMPWEIILELVKRMDSKDRSAWRLVNKTACQAVYEGTTALSPSSTTLQEELSALPLPLLSKCSGLEQLSCKWLKRLSSIQGLPPGLSALDISETSVTDMSPLRQCTGLRQLSANYIHGDIDIPPLAAVLLQLTGLQWLGLAGSVPETASIQALAPAIQGLSQLQHLDLRENEMDTEGAAALGPAIQGLDQLQHLDLAGNVIDAEGARALAPALQRLTRLQRLCLFHNDLGPEGIAALAPSIKELRALHTLDLGYNHRLDAEAAQALALSLRELTELMELGLLGLPSWCNMTPGAAQALAPAIKALPHLNVLLHNPDRALLDEAVAALPVDA